MKTVFTILILLIFFSSCTQKSIEIKDSLSKNTEADNGAKDVEAHFGGHCIYSIDSSKIANLTITLVNSDSVEKQKSVNLFFRVAYTFFRNINTRHYNYGKLIVALQYPDSAQEIYEVSTKDLKVAVQKMPLVLNVIKLIQEKKYDSLYNRLNSHIINDTLIEGYNARQMINDIKSIDKTNGAIVAFYPFNIDVSEQKSKKKILQIYGTVQREKKNNPFSICFNADETDSSVYMVKYKLQSGNYFGIRYMVVQPHHK